MWLSFGLTKVKGQQLGMMKIAARLTQSHAGNFYLRQLLCDANPAVNPSLHPSIFPYVYPYIDMYVPTRTSLGIEIEIGSE